MRFFLMLRQELAMTIKRPARLVNLFRPSRVKQAMARAPWRGLARQGLSVRAYRSYEEYLRHQASKLEIKGDLSWYDENFRHALRERLVSNGIVRKRANVLCLGARQGTEVKAFDDLGCFAVGIDLNAGRDNPWVLPGDFHGLRFADACVDFVFTNSLDHALDPERALAEIQRVLKPEGWFILEVPEDTNEHRDGYYESFAWKRIEDLLALLEVRGFEIVQSATFDVPWPGRHVYLRSRSEFGQVSPR